MKKVFVAIVLSCAVALLYLVGCTKEDPVSTSGSGLFETNSFETSEIAMDRFEAPGGLVDVTWQGETVTFWPYTGENFSGTGKDPINLVFVGQADPLKIRAALLALDGDRSAYTLPGTDIHLPDMPPFNSTWSDALGNLQVGYAEGGGWTGAVIQLQLGAYGPLRFHLRLFECGQGFGADGCWTLGGAHFEIQIPGTADHQVLAWNLAEWIVFEDLKRGGLLDPGSLTPPLTDGINQAPTFRDIPEAIYDGVPDELKILCDLPPGPGGGPVPIPTDGKATILHVAGAVPVEPGTKVEALTVQFAQMIPMPLCSEGPLDYIYLEGPLSLEKTVRVDEHGRYQYSSSIAGRLTATPMDVMQNPPVPAGEPFLAIVSDEQRGVLDGHLSRAIFSIKRIAPLKRGAEKLVERLQVSSTGENSFRSREQCLGPDN